MQSPWTVTGSEIKYENPWISVREDQVVRPDGKPGIFGVVTMQPGVSVLALDDDTFVYLVKEYRYGVARETLEVVSGGINKNESPKDAAEKELQEEAGIIAERLTDLGSFDPFTSVVVSPVRLFLAEKLTYGSQRLEGTEKITIVKLPFVEAVKKVMNGEITHGGSDAVILKAWHYMQSR